MAIPPFSLDEEYVNTIISQIEFPFSAFGLLLDNFSINSACIINIQIESGSSKVKRHIKIEDNGLPLGRGQAF